VNPHRCFRDGGATPLAAGIRALTYARILMWPIYHKF
jgi:hypothetical protein